MRPFCHCLSWLISFISLAIFCFPSLLMGFVSLVIQNPSFLVILSLSSLVLAICLILGMYKVAKKNFFQLSLKCPSVTIEEAIIKDYVDQYWKEIFPSSRIKSLVVLHSKHKLEIIANIPDLPFEERNDLFQRIQNELGVILARKMGYEKEFLLTITD